MRGREGEVGHDRGGRGVAEEIWSRCESLRW